MPLKNIQAFSVESPEIARDSYYPDIDECPSCHYAIEAKILTAYYVKGEGISADIYDMYLIFQCRKCKRLFMSKFKGTYANGDKNTLIFEKHVYSVPSLPHGDAIPIEIQELSEDFATIYVQAGAAEAQGLEQVCGVGYRKALEFLVKDYLCRLFPDQSDAIRSEPLGKSIERIDHEKIKILAKRSAWIGNDETHYVRKHSDLDVGDMKRFIKAMLTYIESELAVAEALNIEAR